MRRATALLLLLLLPCASAQSSQDDPTLNESDFNSTVPEDDTYLNETNDTDAGNGTGSDPTLADSDFNTSLPDEDTSYLDQNEPPPAGATPPAGGSPATKGAPGFGVPALALGIALAALAARRSRDR